MALRTHEIHPALVHIPLTLVPAALAVDALASITRSNALAEAGRWLTPVAAASAAITGVFGYVAQGAVRAEGRAHDMLVTHRNLNTALVAISAAMAASRVRRRRPSALHLLAGFGGVLVMGYTAYLGGKMVYAHGVGVEPGGVRIDESPELRPGSLTNAARRSARHVLQQVKASGREIAAGELAPAMRPDRPVPRTPTPSL